MLGPTHAPTIILTSRNALLSERARAASGTAASEQHRVAVGGDRRDVYRAWRRTIRGGGTKFRHTNTPKSPSTPLSKRESDSLKISQLYSTARDKVEKICAILTDRDRDNQKPKHGPDLTC